MTWFKVDDQFIVNPKTAPLSWAAKGLWAHAGAWAAGQLTDGHIPARILLMWHAPSGLVDELVSVGLWDKTDTGYLFHDWLKYQPSRERVEAQREALKRRVTRHRNSVGNGVTNAYPVPVPVPVPTLPERELSPFLSENSEEHPRDFGDLSGDRESDLKRGNDFMLAATGGRPWQFADHEKALIGAQPEEARRKALKAIADDPWCQANLGYVSPKHVLKKWNVYSTGSTAMKLAKANTKETQKAQERVEDSKAALQKLEARKAKLNPNDLDDRSELFTVNRLIDEEQERLDRRLRERHALTG